MEGENEPQQMLWLVFLDTLNGPPIFWVPPRVSTFPISPSSDDAPPTSLWKGEGRQRLRPRF
jgi:hypothetical protein